MVPIIIFLLFQVQRDPVRSLDEIRLKQSAELERFDRERQTVIRLQKSEFEERLKDLNLAVADFSREYNESRGEVWPKQKAESLAKAIKC